MDRPAFAHLEEALEAIRQFTAEQVRQENARWTDLHSASAYGHADSVTELNSQGHAPDVADNRGLRPLDLAAQQGHEDIVRILLDRGAPVNATNEGGGTALHAAILAMHPGVVRLLLEAGANPGLRTRGGDTALKYASMMGQAELIRLLEGHQTPHSTGDREGRGVCTRFDRPINIVSIERDLADHIGETVAGAGELPSSHLEGQLTCEASIPYADASPCAEACVHNCVVAAFSRAALSEQGVVTRSTSAAEMRDHLLSAGFRDYLTPA